MITKKGYRVLGLGFNEHGIKYLVHIPPKLYLYGVFGLKYQVNIGDINAHPPLHNLLPTPTLHNFDIHQDVAKKVYVQLMNSKKEYLDLC